MPYIKSEDRPSKDIVVTALIDNGVDAQGIQKILIAYCKKYIKTSYNAIKNYNGELVEASEEMYRRRDYLLSSCKVGLDCVKITDQTISLLIDKMHECDVKADGDLNYILFKYCKDAMETPEQVSSLSWYIARTSHIIRQEILGAYEDGKIIENGDV